jgi:hypothetical protein
MSEVESAAIMRQLEQFDKKLDKLSEIMESLARLETMRITDGERIKRVEDDELKINARLDAIERSHATLSARVNPIIAGAWIGLLGFLAAAGMFAVSQIFGWKK